MSKQFCPKCGEPLYRSHSRSFSEKLIKTFSRLKLYRCHECGWRDWLALDKPKSAKPSSRKLQFIALTLLVILVMALLAVYVAGS
jgi:predicted RNA-binding Zn-ribbon protein involved in translation (DUF1610 family)